MVNNTAGNQWKSFLIIGLIIAGILVGLLTVQQGNAFVLLGLLVGILPIFIKMVFDRPILGLWLMLILVPAELMLPVISEDLAFSKVVGFVVLGIVLLQVMNKRIAVPRKNLVTSEIFFLIWLIASGISIILAPDVIVAINTFFRLAQMVCLYAIVQLLLNNEQRIEQVLTIMVFSGVILPIFAVLRFYALSTGITDEKFGGNTTAMLLCAIVPITFCKLKLSKATSKKIIYMALFVVYMVCIPFSWSRGSVVALCVTLVFMLLVNRVSLVNWLLVIIGIYLFSQFIPQLLITRLSTISLDATDGWAGRLDSIWPSAIKIGLDHFWGGVGVGNLGNFMYDYQARMGITDFRTGSSAHNNLIEIFAETGIVGLIGWIGSQLALFFNLLNARRVSQMLKQDKLEIISSCLLASFVGLTVASMSNTATYLKDTWIVYGAITATSTAIFTKERLLKNAIRKEEIR